MSSPQIQITSSSLENNGSSEEPDVKKTKNGDYKIKVQKSMMKQESFGNHKSPDEFVEIEKAILNDLRDELKNLKIDKIEEDLPDLPIQSNDAYYELIKPLDDLLILPSFIDFFPVDKKEGFDRTFIPLHQKSLPSNGILREETLSQTKRPNTSLNQLNSFKSMSNLSELSSQLFDSLPQDIARRVKTLDPDGKIINLSPSFNSIIMPSYNQRRLFDEDPSNQLFESLPREIARKVKAMDPDGKIINISPHFNSSTPYNQRRIFGGDFSLPSSTPISMFKHKLYVSSRQDSTEMSSLADLPPQMPEIMMFTNVYSPRQTDLADCFVKTGDFLAFLSTLDVLSENKGIYELKCFFE
jgi:hypothetical protein